MNRTTRGDPGSSSVERCGEELERETEGISIASVWAYEVDPCWAEETDERSIEAYSHM